MKISNIHVDIKENDLFDILTEVLEEHIQMKEIDIISLLINENIYIEGIFKHKIKIKFSIKLSLDKVEDNTLYLNLDCIKCMNIKVGKILIRTMFNILLKEYGKIGIALVENKLVIDLNKLMPAIPFVNFKLENLKLGNGCIITEISDMIYDKEKDAPDIGELLDKEKISKVSEDKKIEGELEKVEKEEVEDEINPDGIVEDTCATVNKVSDKYSEIRSSTTDIIDSKCEGISKYAMIVPDIIALIVRLFKDKRVKKKDKIIAGIMLTYVAVPFDVIPENVPILGKVDDIIILFVGLDYLLNSVDSKVIKENWEGQDDLVLLIKTGVSHVSEFSVGGKLKKFINVINTI